LLIRSFAALQLPLLLKWPNDLVLMGEHGPGKLGGLLLEERSRALLAGLGVNVSRLPAAAGLRPDAALPAARLPENFRFGEPITLWLELVHNALLVYKNMFTASSFRELLWESEKYLLWKGSEVQVLDAYESGSITRGLLCGLTELGGLRLLASTTVTAGSSSHGAAADRADSLRNCGDVSLYSGSLSVPSDMDSG
jgi:biotin-(acetyl-CoA carboxylase) ligase